MSEKFRSDATRKRNLLALGIIFLSSIFLFILIQAGSGLYPFGSKSNMLWDQDIQYVDYFAYYRNVLLGKADIGYSFTKSLGGSLVALFGYYLGCPLNLLVVFFKTEQLPLFLFILTAVKQGLAGVTAGIFFWKRFPAVSLRMRTLISLSYALMQYNMLQSSNIMWLDGVILLPLLLLAVYRFVSENRKRWLFLTVLFSIAINWYTGYMTGLFAVCYFLYERILKIDKPDAKERKRFIKDTILCGGIMLAGVLGSCFIFYPVVVGLQKGKDAFVPEIFHLATHGSLLDAFKGFALGSYFESVSLYCGLLFFGFFLYYFFSRHVEKKEKILSVIAVMFMLVSCWFVPLDCIWSGLRYVASYPFRFAFIVIFLVLYLAARGVQEYEKVRDGKKMAAVYAGCILLFLVYHLAGGYGKNQLLLTEAVLAVYALLYLLSGMGKRKQVGLKNLVPAVLAVELVLNGIMTFQMNYEWNQDISAYQEYTARNAEQVAAVKKLESDEFYRMDTLNKRYDEESRCSAFLNEAMVYDYRGLNHYSSTFDGTTGDLLRDIGYSSESTISIVSESSLPADSLLGVKYLLSAAEAAGYEKVDSIPEANGKSVYYNLYALDAGMEAADTVYEKTESANPFEYQNILFSKILGREVALYKKAEPEVRMEDQVLIFSIPASGKEDLLYGYVDSWVHDLVLYVDGEYRCNYATWLSYKIFNVGDGTKAHTAALDGYSGKEQDMTPYFYYLDQDLFEEVIQELKGKEMVTEKFEDGYVKGSYTAVEDCNMLLSIPYDDGWTASVNGKKVEIRPAANALMAIPLSAGENIIELKYEIPGVKAGIGLSILGLFMFLGICWMDRTKKPHALHKN